MATYKKSNQSDSSHLSAKQINLIEKALKSIPDFGEVRLIIEKGILKFLVVQKSYNMLDVNDEEIERIKF